LRDVAFSCDDNGAKFLRVTVWSLLTHYHGEEPIRINVFTGFGGHSPENQAKLQAVVDRFNSPTQSATFVSVRYHDVEPWVKPHADLIMNREKSRWNVFTWTPIFTPAILSDATGNVAHFDIDMLFNDDVSKLLDLDLGDNLIGAVAEYGKGDPVITEAVWGKGILPDEAERYFNTGTIVFNAAKCREERTWEKILAWYRDHYDVADRIEQDAWNALYWRRTLLLPLKWNFHDRLIKTFAKADLGLRFWQGNPPVESLEAALEPSILHFWGPKKPWKTCHRPYRRLYHEAMRAVGLEPPREPLLAPVQDFLGGRQKRRCLIRWLDLTKPAWRKARKRYLIKRFKHALLLPFEWSAIALGIVSLVFLPRRVLFSVCDVFAAVMYAFDREGKRRSLENLHIVRGCCTGKEGTPAFDPSHAAYRPTRNERLVIRRAYRNMARTVGYAIWTLLRARRRCAETGELSGTVRAFLQANRPAVTVSGHIGCWEILSQLAFLDGHRMMSVAKDIGTQGMTRLLMRARRSIGQEIVPADGAFRALMSGIRQGKSLGLLVDQRVNPKDGGVWVRFLGKQLPVSAAPAFFAAKAKAPVIVAWSRPLADGRYRCEFVASYDASAARDIRGLTQKIADDLARVIRRHPSCWVLNYNYFSNIPPSERTERKVTA